MKNKLDEHKGFIIDIDYFYSDTNKKFCAGDLIIIPNYYIELMIAANKSKSLYSNAKKILNVILLNKDDIVYIDNKDLFKKIAQLIKSDNKELVRSMFNTIKEFENKNERNKRVKRFKELIK
jgi:hypothetical protein